MPDSAVLWGRTSHPTLLFLVIDLTEIQCDVSDISRQYEGLGTALRERLQQLSAMLERMQAVQEEAGAVLQWLESKERTLSELEASSSPTKTETMRAQAEHNKVSASERSCVRRPHQQARCCCCCCGQVEVPDLPWGIPSRWGRSLLPGVYLPLIWLCRACCCPPSSLWEAVSHPWCSGSQAGLCCCC